MALYSGSYSGRLPCFVRRHFRSAVAIVPGTVAPCDCVNKQVSNRFEMLRSTSGVLGCIVPLK